MASKKFNMFNILGEDQVKVEKTTNTKTKNSKKEEKKHIPWSNPTGCVSWALADEEPDLDFTQPLNINAFGDW